MDPHSQINSRRIALNRALEIAPTLSLGAFEGAVDVKRWTLDRNVLRLLWTLVQEVRPRHVIEFGSGLSTRVLASAATASRAETWISSVDHDPEFGAESALIFDREIGLARVKFQIAPLVVRSFGGDFLPAYHIDDGRLACSEPVELALIDGPPEQLGGRAGTLYQIMQYARPGTLVLLDDAARSGEKAALDHWQGALGDAIEIIRPSGFSKGLAAILIHWPVARDKLWDRRQELAIADIVAKVPANAPAVLVDEWQWDRSRLSSHSIRDVVGEDGRRLGAPSGDCESLSWLRAVKNQGTRFVVFGWPAFWWQHTYPSLWEKLERESTCVLANQRVVILDLQSAHHEVG